MADSLVIVESPAKAKTLSKYLGKDFLVRASVGHVRDLPKSKLGVDIANNFKPQYETLKGKEKVIKELRETAKKVKRVYLAPDPDREGEAIAWHIAEALAKEIKGKEVHRVLLTEITKSGVQEAIKNPTTLHKDLFEAQQARRVLDRLVGYKLSPLLWAKVQRGLSAGRVQSVAVRIVVEREREIAAFVAEEYWTIAATLIGDAKKAFDAELITRDGEKISIGTADEANALVEAMRGRSFSVTGIQKKQRRRNPEPPFITARLQQEAARKLGFSAKKTMTLAQHLYEGVELPDEGLTGLITYMRTDSTRVSGEALNEARQFITTSFGGEFLPEKPNVYSSKKGAQDAHEAIRPTSVTRTPGSLRQVLDKDEYRLYELIFNRFVASQMVPALYDQTRADITAGPFGLKATGSVLVFPGFLRVYHEDRDEGDVVPEDESEENKLLPPLKQGEALAANAITPTQHFTQPPPRYTEASLVKELEQRGIGRPSTYASIMGTITDKKYVTKDKNRFFATELGMLVTDLLVTNFPRILDVQFTAHMEEDLDKVADGEMDWVAALHEFYGPFQESLTIAESQMTQVKGQEEPTDLPCPKCGKELVIKWGRRGSFIACSAYPECKFTANFTRGENGAITIQEKEDLGITCEKCSAPMAVRRSRFGKEFLGCTAYPKCKNIKNFMRGENGTFTVTERIGPVPTDIACEKCGGTMVIRTGKRGEFLGCGAFPKCRNIKNFTRAEDGKITVVEREPRPPKEPKAAGARKSAARKKSASRPASSTPEE